MISLHDAGLVVLSVFAGWLIVVAPGYALARIFRIDQAAGPLPGPVIGLAVLPLVDSLAIRGFGLDAALAINVALAACAALYARRDGDLRRKMATSPVAFLLALGWLLVLIVESVDVDLAGHLYQPFTVIDMVKHAATTQAIVDTGAPPHDPFFLRPERVGYYYFFYSLTALAERVGAGFIDARSAVCGLVFWTGIGIYQLLRLAIAACGGKPATWSATLAVAILAAGGLDIVGFLRIGLLQGTWLADPTSWNEQVTGWAAGLLWVPHHVVGLIAAIVSLIALSDGATRIGRNETRMPTQAIGLAALCFASAFGLSIWITLALVCTVAVWSGLLLVEGRRSAVLRVLIAAVLAIILAAPQMMDLLAGRAPTSAAPVALTVRVFSPIEGLVPDGGWRLLARFLALPLNYFAAFGLLASGTFLYWRERGAGRLFPTEFARCLAISALSGLLLGGFLKSTLLTNDLGWRVTLFPLFSGTVWTILAIERRSASVRLPSGARPPAAREAVAATSTWRALWSMPSSAVLLLVVGWATVACGLVSLRTYPWMRVEADHRFVAAHPETERALRLAYEWADRNLDPKAVLQHDPTRPRAFAFALYGRHRVAVADSFGALFGADPGAVEARIRSLAPIFRQNLPVAQVRGILAANGIDALVITRDDPIWRIADAAIWRVTPAYASDAVRIVSRRSLNETLPTGLSASAVPSVPMTKDN